MQFHSFDRNIANRNAYANANFADPGGNINFGFGDRIGISTGFIFTQGGEFYYEILGTNRVWRMSRGNVRFGSSVAGNFRRDAENDLSRLLRNQVQIMDLLNVSAAMIAELERKGVNMDTQRNSVQQLYIRLMGRNSTLIDAGILDGIEHGTTDLTNRYGSLVVRIARGDRPLIGVPPLVPIIVKAAVGITMAVVAWQIIRAIFVESNMDLQHAQTLATTIAGMDRDVANRYIRYLNRLAGSGFMRQLKWIALIGGVAFVTYQALPYLQKSKT